MAQMHLHRIRSARSHREYDPPTGFSYGVVIECWGSTAEHWKGDMYLECETHRETGEFAESIERAAQGVRAATVTAVER
ncbi:MAG: hypothetical protein NVSMB52_06410 [Chloroflexota bacterium]